MALGSEYDWSNIESTGTYVPSFFYWKENQNFEKKVLANISKVRKLILTDSFIFIYKNTTFIIQHSIKLHKPILIALKIFCAFRNFMYLEIN